MGIDKIERSNVQTNIIFPKLQNIISDRDKSLYLEKMGEEYLHKGEYEQAALHMEMAFVYYMYFSPNAHQHVNHIRDLAQKISDIYLKNLKDYFKARTYLGIASFYSGNENTYLLEEYDRLVYPMWKESFAKNKKPQENASAFLKSFGINVDLDFNGKVYAYKKNDPQKLVIMFRDDHISRETQVQVMFALEQLVDKGVDLVMAEGSRAEVNEDFTLNKSSSLESYLYKKYVEQDKIIHCMNAAEEFFRDKVRTIGMEPLNYGGSSTFTEVQQVREESFVDTTLKSMEKFKERTGIILAGGAHADGIKDLLEKKNVSYIIFTPQAYIEEESNFKDAVDYYLFNSPYGKSVDYLKAIELYLGQ